MDQIALVGRQLEDGQKLIERLLQEGFEVTTACWARKSEGDWYLYIASPVVGREGPQQTYQLLGMTLAQFPQPLWIEPFDIRLVDAADPFVQDVRKYQSGKPGRRPTHFLGGYLGKMSFAEAYIYTVPAAA